MIKMNKNMLTGTKTTLPRCISDFFPPLPSCNYHHLSHKQQLWGGRGIIRGSFVIPNYLLWVCVHKQGLSIQRNLPPRKVIFIVIVPNFTARAATQPSCVSAQPPVWGIHTDTTRTNPIISLTGIWIGIFQVLLLIVSLTRVLILLLRSQAAFSRIGDLRESNPSYSICYLRDKPFKIKLAGCLPEKHRFSFQGTYP